MNIVEYQWNFKNPAQVISMERQIKDISVVLDVYNLQDQSSK